MGPRSPGHKGDCFGPRCAEQVVPVRARATQSGLDGISGITWRPRSRKPFDSPMEQGDSDFGNPAMALRRPAAEFFSDRTSRPVARDSGSEVLYLVGFSAGGGPSLRNSYLALARFFPRRALLSRRIRCSRTAISVGSARTSAYCSTLFTLKELKISRSRCGSTNDLMRYAV